LYPNGSRVEGFTFPEPIIVTIAVDAASDSDKLYLYDTAQQLWVDAGKIKRFYVAKFFSRNLRRTNDKGC
jgi:hypothetical protein